MRLKGDIREQSDQKKYLSRFGFNVVGSDHGGWEITNRALIKPALIQLFEKEFPGWQAYKEEFIQYGVCTEDGFLAKVKKATKPYKPDYYEKMSQWCLKRDPEETGQWIQFCKDFLNSWGWNEEAIKDFIEWGTGGFNNRALHVQTTVEDFYDEVSYASDRMSLDRLFRCHVKYMTLTPEDTFGSEIKVSEDDILRKIQDNISNADMDDLAKLFGDISGTECTYTALEHVFICKPIKRFYNGMLDDIKNKDERKDS